MLDAAAGGSSNHRHNNCSSSSGTTRMQAQLTFESICLLLLGYVPADAAAAVYGAQSAPIDQDFIKFLSNTTKYNRHATPTQYLKKPSTVSLSMYVESMSSFSPRTMDFQMDVYFQQEWIDTRLKHSQDKRLLLRDEETFKKLWHPDLYFANAKTAAFQTVTMPNFLCWIYANGTVFYDARISLTVICMMDLAKYPLDSQECELRIMSYAYDDTQLQIAWSESVSAVEWNRDVNILDMHVVNITVGSCLGIYLTGNWSCVNVTVAVKRQLTHHVMQTYLPSALIVVISWFSFWLDVDAAPARVSLSITTLLTVSTQANTVKMSLPEVSYMKAIDVWMGVCMTFVFAVMIEFTVCHWARNRAEAEPVNKKSLAKMMEPLRWATASQAIAKAIGVSAQPAFVSRPNDARVLANTQIQVDADSGSVLSERQSPTADMNQLANNNNNNNNNTEQLLDVANAQRAANAQPHAYLFRTATFHQTSTDSPVVLKQRHRSASNVSSTVRGNGRQVAQNIDLRCRWLFPTAFLVFNMTYWSYYLFIADDNTNHMN